MRKGRQFVTGTQRPSGISHQSFRYKKQFLVIPVPVTNYIFIITVEAEAAFGGGLQHLITEITGTGTGKT